MVEFSCVLETLPASTGRSISLFNKVILQIK
jgi:hypothetical protein